MDLPDSSRAYLHYPVDKSVKPNEKKHKIPEPKNEKYFVIDHVESQNTDCV